MSQKIPLYYSLPAIILSTLLVMAVVLAWTEPSVAPPGGNVPAPVNVGSASQYKAGALGIGGVFQAYGGMINPVLNVIGANVGIGTTNPGNSLHISKGGVGVGLFVGDRTPFGQALIETDLSGSATHLWFAELGSRVFSVTGGGNVVAMGNVGIGTASPSQKLDVAGQIHATGDICTDAGGGKCLSTVGGGVVGSPCYDINLDLGPVSKDTGVWSVCNPGYTVTGVYYVTAAAGQYSRIMQIRCCK